jgi:ABC-type dipeptide/oligopeptide/nickel transport system ATPase component
MAKEKVLSVKDLVISFRTDRGIVRAVRGVSFDLYKGETLCIVGESGSGKSVTNKAIMGISARNAIIENGSIMYEGEDLIRVSEEEFHRIRGHKIGMIFQDPLSALNPTMKVGKQIMEASLINHNVLKRYCEDLYSYELTALRNVAANSNYEIKKAKDEIIKNKNIFEKFENAYKSLVKLEKRLSKVQGFKDSKEEKLVAKYNAVINAFNKATTKKADALSDIEKYFNHININVQNDIDMLVKDNEKKAKKLETKIDLSDLKKKIINEKIASNHELINFYSEILTRTFSIDNVKESFVSRKHDLIELQKKYKDIKKKLSPSLKEDLKIKQEFAKAETKKRHEELLKEKDDKIKKAEEILVNNALAVIKLRESLNSEELAKIDEIIKHNNAAEIKNKKESGKFKETNVSKTHIDESLVILSTGNKEYDALLKEEKEAKNSISAANDAYINKTSITKAEAKKMALKVMKEVGIPLPERRFKQYPFEFSGGMRQRIVIAIALTANPDILICDEPTTALDVTIQAQILELINNLKEERNLSCIFITHDLGVVANMADRVAVMYAGKIVEYGTSDEIFFDPRHPLYLGINGLYS